MSGGWRTAAELAIVVIVGLALYAGIGSIVVLLERLRKCPSCGFRRMVMLDVVRTKKVEPTRPSLFSLYRCSRCKAELVRDRSGFHARKAWEKQHGKGGLGAFDAA